ncbi:MAG TPA: PAS domain S-box protein, partial [Candidatus Methanoperedens sp.]|nr:PAS domain S-box protein [Candidatus Methanoperedens sp.]
MTGARHSIATRILLPIFILAGGTTVAMLLAVYQITSRVQEDYHRFTVLSSSASVSIILGQAAAELTAARLTDNPVVVEAKMETVREAILAYWERSQLDGVIADGGNLAATTLDAETTRRVLADVGKEYFSISTAAGELHCHAQRFSLWGWTVTTVVRHGIAQGDRTEVAYLLPLLALGSVLLAAAVYFVLWRNLRRPVAGMVAAVAGGREVPPSGIAEFDRIGSTVNEALARVRLRTEQLMEELGQRRKAEASLREKEEHIRLLLNSTAEGIYGVDLAGTCTFCNPAGLRLLGFEREAELVGRNIHELVHHTRRDGTAYPEAQCRIYQAYRERREVHADDEVFWRRDGTSFPVEYWSHPILDEGAVAGAVVAFFDVTHKSELEQQLRHAQKMEAVGRLAGGIAHDFNNMLMAIVGYASMLQQQAAEGSKLRHYSDQVLAAADKAADLTRQILAFSRKQVMSPAPVDLNEVILGLGKILTRLLGEDIQISLDLSGARLVTLADRGQIEQALMNLCTNARDAMPAGGRLSIGTRAIDFDREGAGIHGLEVAGAYALITVSDTGVGIDSRTRERIFEPFFTTK